MTKAEFRANPDLVKQWRDELHTNQLLQIVLGVMDEESPTRQEPETVSETAALISYGRHVGYSEYDRELRSLGAEYPTPKFLKANYGVPDPETPKKPN